MARRRMCIISASFLTCASTTVNSIYLVNLEEVWSKQEPIFNLQVGYREKGFILGYHFQVHGNQVFSEYSYHVDKSKVNAVGVFLGTTSDELFQPYRLYNALIYLQRKGVSTKDVDASDSPQE